MTKMLSFFKNKKILSIILGSVAVITIIVVAVNLNKKENIDNKPEMCVVQFEANGGTTVAQQEIECGSVIVQPDNPQKEGFVFKYWEYNGEEYNFSNPVETNIVLKPFYEVEENVEIVVISFDTKGGNKIEDIKIKKGETIEKPISPKKAGYKFIGWYIDKKEYNFSNPIDKDITLEAKWEKNIENSKPNTGNNNSTSNENSNTNSNENKEDTKLDVFHEYDDLVNSYLGTWYLSGYEDIYLEVSRKQFVESAYMSIETINFSMPSGGKSSFRTELPYVKYPCTKEQDINGCGFSSSATIEYIDWANDLSENKITLNSNSIDIAGNIFVRNKGTKNKYTGAMFEKAIGKWYLYNHPNSYINISSEGDIKTPYDWLYYCISYNAFNLTTFELSSYGSLACERASNDSLFKKYGITVSDDILTINNGKETRKFYKTAIVEKVSNIELNKSSIDLNIGESEGLTASISPSNAFNKEVTWSSSDTTVATVSSNGTVTAKKKGVATITATTKDGNKTATCVVNVKTVNVTGITLNKTTLNLVRNQTGTLSVTVLPTNATNKNYTWSSSDTTVATVSSDGVVTAKKKGVAIITVTTEDGSKTASCTVDVSNPKLTADPSIGLSYIAGSTGASRGIKVTVTASGGSGSYNYYSIKLYKDGVLIGSNTNTNSNTLFVEGHSNGSYYAEIEVHDSEGNVFNATSSVSTISGF